MAQKREKEETELKVPQKSIPLRTPNPPPSSPPSISSSLPTPAEISDDSRSTSSFVSEPKSDLEDSSRRRSLKRQREVNRCSGIGCRRKVGLIGFRCRCGDVFCSEHRYSDRHECSFDYKAAGREAIARENPVVRAAKILKV